MDPKFRNALFPRGKAAVSRVGSLLVMIPMLLLLPASVSAQFVYTNYGGEITITGCTNCAGSMVIPETIDGLPVTDLEYGALSGCPGLTNISVPDTIIYFLSFDMNPNLQAIEVDPANPVYSSFDGVLFNHDQTELLECPSGRGGSFTIPDTVTNFGGDGFFSCTKLASVTLGAGMTSIPSGAFQGCLSLTNVAIPETVTNIGAWAFEYCEQLPSFNIPPGTPYIGEGTFQQCFSLSSVTMPDTVTKIGAWAFYYCTNLSAVTIPNSVTVISNNAFENCSRLTNLWIPESVVDIQGFAFYYSGLIHVIVPGSVTNIGQSAIEGPNLDAVAFSGDAPTLVDSIGWEEMPPYVFYAPGTAGWGSDVDGFPLMTWDPQSGLAYMVTNGTVIITRYLGTNSVVIIPHTINGLPVTTINSTLWARGRPLPAVGSPVASIIVPSSVTSIGEYAFYYEGPNFTSLYFEGDAPTAPNDLFYPNDVTVYYLPGTTGWGTNFGGAPTAQWQLPNPCMLNAGASLGVNSNQFSFVISWATNRTVRVEACSNLSAPAWAPVSTNVLVNGVSYFSDATWTNAPCRFYRIVSP